MYIYREAPEALHIAIALQNLKAFLLRQNFTREFLDTVGIFVLPRRSDGDVKEQWVAEHSPVATIIFLYYDSTTCHQLNRSLLRLIRGTALQWAQSLGKNAFPGSGDISDKQQDLEQFGALASSFSFVTFSEQEQPQEETDSSLFMQAFP